MNHALTPNAESQETPLWLSVYGTWNCQKL